MKRVLKWDVPVAMLNPPYYIGAGPVVHVASQYGRTDVVQVWTEEDAQGHDLAGFYVIGTGHSIPEGTEHVGSVVVAGGHLVWHVYQEVKP